MQINATSPGQAALAYTRQASQQQQQQQTQAVTEAHKTFTPTPGLRPNVQDYIDINRTLIALRRL